MICVSRLLFYAYICGRLMFIRIAIAFAIFLCLMPVRFVFVFYFMLLRFAFSVTEPAEKSRPSQGRQDHFDSFSFHSCAYSAMRSFAVGEQRL